MKTARCRKPICLGILLAAVGAATAAEPPAFDAQRIADDFEAALPADDFPQQKLPMEGALPADRFDVNRYFAVLDALKLAEGWTLDWVYCNRGIGGFPVLYARRSDAAPFPDHATYEAQATNALPAGAEAREFLRYGYLEKIEVEDSPRGYFQLAVLRLLGDRFQLFWHEFYNEIHLVCSAAGWKERLKFERQRGEPYRAPPRDFVAAAKKLNFAPQVRLADDRAEVAVTTYSPFGGLTRHEFAFARTAPHRLLKQEATPLVLLEQHFVF